MLLRKTVGKGKSSCASLPAHTEQIINQALVGQSKGKKLNHQRMQGKTGIPEKLFWGTDKIVVIKLISLETWLNLFLFLPRSTIPYLQPLGPDVLQNSELFEFQKGNMVHLCILHSPISGVQNSTPLSNTLVFLQ